MACIKTVTGFDITKGSGANTDGTTNTSERSMKTVEKQFKVFMKIANRTDGTYNFTVETSPNGVDWFSLGTTGNQTADGNTVIDVAASALAFRRVRGTLVQSLVTSGADVEASFHIGE